MGELLWQISNCLLYLHQRGFAHLDVKPDNILIIRKREAGEKKDEWNFKLSDFGCTRQVECDVITDGDGRYLPP